mgnify:CR=1 FL=1|tara:strand:- start:164 stop:712 length:549 start_codon:yes stop_codon:yes gene_type:complete
MKITPMIIHKECSDFLQFSNGTPLVKCLPTTGSDMRKVKVRKKNSFDSLDHIFNMVFSDHENIRQRCIFANTEKSLSSLQPVDNEETFYIFPKNGFLFKFNPNINRSSLEFQETIDKLIALVGETDAFSKMKDVVNYGYSSGDAHSIEYALNSDCEIIIHGIPYFFAVRKSSVKSYSTLFSL